MIRSKRLLLILSTAMSMAICKKKDIIPCFIIYVIIATPHKVSLNLYDKLYPILPDNTTPKRDKNKTVQNKKFPCGKLFLRLYLNWSRNHIFK